MFRIVPNQSGKERDIFRPYKDEVKNPREKGVGLTTNTSTKNIPLSSEQGGNVFSK